MEITLDAEQKKAVEYEGGPLLVVAGPGSGKTRVLTERVRHLVRQGKATPEEILCLTFTDKAAGEMTKRLEKQGMDVSNMDIGTFHSFARKVLSDNELETGLDIHGGVLEKAEAAVWAINHIDDFGLKSVKVGNNAPGVIRSMMDGISSFAKALYTPDDIDKYVSKRIGGADEDEEEELLALADLSRVYRAYQEFKKSMHVIDYDDMVSEAIRLFEASPTIRRRYRKRYKHILVDELQDNNFAQFRLVRQLAEGGNVTGVGDGDQSIYSFQGAYRGIFDEFRDSFEGTHVVNLTTNYRSTENIVRVTNDWMEGKTGSFAKRLHSASKIGGEKIAVVECDTDTGEAEYVANKIVEIEGLPHEARSGDKGANYKEIAILTRRKIDGDKFEAALAERGIPVKYAGSTDLLYTPIVRDLMAHIKIAARPSTSGAEITQLMKMHGITEKNIARINRAAKMNMFKDQKVGGGGGDYVLVTIKGEDGYRRPRTTQEREMDELERKIDRLIDIGRGTMPLDQAVHTIMMSVSGLYKKVVKDDSKHGKTQRWQLNEVHRIAAEHAKLYRESTLEEFIKYMYQMGEQEGESRDSLAAENAVEITTIHQSKGREFKMVFVPCVSRNRLPTTYKSKKFNVPDDLSRDKDGGADKKAVHKNEERRLLYVAMTRAKDRLFITFSTRYGENVKDSKPSEFLGEDELDYENNKLIAAGAHAGDSTGAPAEKPGVVERLVRDKQEQAINAVGGMSLNTAVRRIVELSKIKYFEMHGKLGGFDPAAVLDTSGDEDGADMDDELRGSKQGLLDADSFEFSASKIEAYERCPLLFKFRHVLEVPSRSSGASYKGIAVHAVLEKIGLRRMDGEDTSEEQAMELLEMHWEDDAFDNKKASDENKEAAKEMIYAVIKRDRDAAQSGSTIVGVEKKFALELDEGLKFGGKMDRIDKALDGSYTVIDYKTGKAKDIRKIAENIQMNMYAMGTESIYDRLPAKAMQLYVPDLKEVGFAIQKGQLDKQRGRIAEVAKAALRGEFDPTPSAKACHGCNYLDICDDRHPGSEKRR